MLGAVLMLIYLITNLDYVVVVVSGWWDVGGGGRGNPADLL